MGSRGIWIVRGPGAGAGAGGTAGVREGVTGTVSSTTGGLGVATGVVPGCSVPVHPLMRTIPVTRTVTQPVSIHCSVVVSRILTGCPYSPKYISPGNAGQKRTACSRSDGGRRGTVVFWDVPEEKLPCSAQGSCPSRAAIEGYLRSQNPLTTTENPGYPLIFK